MRTISWVGVWGCCWVAGLAVSVQGAEFILKPIRASGTYSVSGDEIRLTGTPQRVFLEVQMQGWTPNRLKIYQAKIDSTGYGSGTSGTITPAVQPCSGPNSTGNNECTAAFGAKSLCNVPPNVGQFCEAGFINKFRTDFVFFEMNIGTASVDLSSFNYRYVGVLEPGNSAEDPGIPKYGGALVLDVPSDVTGTFTIGFDLEGGADTYMADPTNSLILPITGTPAKITILCATNANCNDNDACTTDTCNADGTCSNTDNYNAATHCCNPINGSLTLLTDGIQCTDDVCNADTGQVTHPNSAATTPCGNPLNSQCDRPDSCDGAGNCLARLEPPGTACGSTTNTDCNGADTCDGAGACLTNIRGAGTPCGDPSDTPCDNPDTCNGLGACLVNNEPNGLACSTGQFCMEGERCSSAVCTGGTPRNCADLLTCTTDSCNETDNRCDHPLQAGKCLIGDVCYLAGELHPPDLPDDPGNTCEECDPALSGTTWSVKPDTSPCNDGNACTGTGRPLIGIDTCTAGVCSGVTDPECNDDCDFAVPAIVGTNLSNNSSAGADDGEASCQPDSNHDVWFKFTAACDGITFASTTGSELVPSNDTVLSVYTDCPAAGGTEFACDDDSGVALQSALNFATTNGTTYLVRVAGFEDDKGPIVLNIRPVDDCLIDNVCYAARDRNPENDCQACIPQVSTTEWSPLAEGTACGDPLDTLCDSPDACDGAGFCEVNYKPDGIECSDEVPADVCTKNLCQSGVCTHPPEPAGLACGDPTDRECDNPDTCDGGGGCAVNLEDAGRACGDPTDEQCDNPDICDGLGGCLDNPEIDGTACNDTDVCTGDDKCMMGVCVGTSVMVPPIVQAISSRHLYVTPQTGISPAPVALLVTSPTWPCLYDYVDENGRLVPPAERIFQFPADWGTITVQDPDVVPSSLYLVQAECGAYLSAPAAKMTHLWGDVDNNGLVEGIDINIVIYVFKGFNMGLPREAVDLAPCTPDGKIDGLDISFVIDAFKGFSYPCSPPCH